MAGHCGTLGSRLSGGVAGPSGLLSSRLSGGGGAGASRVLGSRLSRNW